MADEEPLDGDPATEAARRRRFLFAARGRGFRFSPDVFTAGQGTGARAPVRRTPLLVGGAIAASLVLAAGAAYRAHRAVSSQSVVVTPAHGKSAATPEQRDRADEAARSEALRTLRLEIERARRAERASAGRAASMQATVAALEQKVRALQRELSAAGAERTGVQARLDEAQRSLESTTRELSDARRQNAADAMLLELQDTRLAALTTQARDSEDQVTRQKQLLAASRDIRDLMGARNLHVIDVFDVDGRGKTRRAFGRAFYTEGKSLIFYAFDLTSLTTRPASFQAWGQREAGGNAALSLGLLYADDQTQNRWTLKFEDARVLEQIDAVFVTVEPPGGSQSPRGRKLLYAYLRQKPNHP